ncbi:hypothetical protein OPAG_06606 [Rhodococcus opacus PD630]|nr:hypothetical protein OPAG_06606 [Rhodococcus opacus PD630]
MPTAPAVRCTGRVGDGLGRVHTPFDAWGDFAVFYCDAVLLGSPAALPDLHAFASWGTFSMAVRTVHRRVRQQSPRRQGRNRRT